VTYCVVVRGPYEQLNAYGPHALAEADALARLIRDSEPEDVVRVDVLALEQYGR